MKKFLRLGALSLALIMGFSSCSKNKENTPNNDADNLSTYVGVNIAFPTADGLRALPDDYNNKYGNWEGRDKIEKITIYLVNKTQQKVDYATFNKGSFKGINAQGMLEPTLAVKATAGDNVDAYAVINDINGKTNDLKTTPWSNFDEKFKSLEVKVNSSQDVAMFDGTNDVVMMTNAKKAASITVKENVTEEKAKSGAENRADIEVSRVVSRALVTIGGSDMKINVKDVNGKDISIATVKEVKYAVGQSNKRFFNMQKTDFSTPNPVYEYVPTSQDWKDHNIEFDYSDLTNAQALQTVTAVDAESVKKALNDEKFSKFVLPVTHETEAKYKKGNMTYFEITCKFEVDNVYTSKSDADGSSVTKKVGTLGETVYLGMSDGKFYDTREHAKANGQQVTGYPKGTMKYVIWLNPNVDYGEATKKITMSPTVRNQIYHAHISGFKEIGVPTNPLNPNDPKPDPEDPENPINPGDDPETQKTYLSVSVKVLPWTIHSYTVDLGNRY